MIAVPAVLEKVGAFAALYKDGANEVITSFVSMTPGYTRVAQARVERDLRGHAPRILGIAFVAPEVEVMVMSISASE